jgi:hypothetical protein
VLIAIALLVVLLTQGSSTNANPSTTAQPATASSCQSSVAAIENFVRAYPPTQGPLSAANQKVLHSLEQNVTTKCPAATTHEVAVKTIVPWLSSLSSSATTAP